MYCMPRFSPQKNPPSRSPSRTPVKLYNTCLSDLCLICDLNLKKETKTVYFNVKSCPYLSQVIRHVPDSTKESESSVKKAQAAQLVLEDIAKNYQDASKAAKFRGCASVRVKRQLANSSPKNCAG